MEQVPIAEVDVRVDVDEIWSDYAVNEELADEKYKGRTVAALGRILNASAGETTVLRLTNSDGPGHEVVAVVRESDRDKILTVQDDDLVIVVCTCGGLVDGDGIELYVLREKKDEDWDGLIKTIGITMVLNNPGYHNIRFIPDEAWIKSQLVAAGHVVTPGQYELNFYPAVQLSIFESGKICDLAAILRPFTPRVVGEVAKASVMFEQGDALMVEVADFPLPQIRCLGVEADVSVTTIEMPIEINFDHMVAYCFRNVLNGDSQFLAADGGAPRRN